MINNNDPLAKYNPQNIEVSNNRTLLERQILEFINLVFAQNVDSERLTTNLHQLATRAMFNGTGKKDASPPEDYISNRDLLEILLPPTINAVAGRDTKAARNLRSVGEERSLKLSTLKNYSLDLLISGRVSQADCVRSLVVARIFEEARGIHKELVSKYGREVEYHFKWYETGEIPDDLNPEYSNYAVTKCIDNIMKTQYEEAIAAKSPSALTHPHFKYRYFLHTAAQELLYYMDADRNVFETINHLVTIVYPNFNAVDINRIEIR